MKITYYNKHTPDALLTDVSIEFPHPTNRHTGVFYQLLRDVPATWDSIRVVKVGSCGNPKHLIAIVTRSKAESQPVVLTPSTRLEHCLDIAKLRDDKAVGAASFMRLEKNSVGNSLMFAIDSPWGKKANYSLVEGGFRNLPELRKYLLPHYFELPGATLSLGTSSAPMREVDNDQLALQTAEEFTDVTRRMMLTLENEAGFEEGFTRRKKEDEGAARIFLECWVDLRCKAEIKELKKWTTALKKPILAALYTYFSWDGSPETEPQGFRFWRDDFQLFPEIKAQLAPALSPNSSVSQAESDLRRHLTEVKQVVEATERLITSPNCTFNKELIMAKPNIIKIESIVHINGRPASDFQAPELYELIAQQEAAIEQLNKIKTKPKKLQAEIDERQAGIEALVSHLDAQDAKA